MTDRPAGERSLFEAALEQGSPPARAAYLEQACRGDDALRREVEALLAAHDRLGGFGPNTCAPGLPTTLGEAAGDPQPGIAVGPYTLLQPLGEGGMGIVFLAEQTHPVRRQVALKVIKAGMDSRQVLARFEAERQTLALMDHPNIAKVLDAGTTADGHPYFVMERVQGVPLTQFCDAYRLTPRQRLQLFLPVCQAVQHAHQKGIIHRDLKPSNVLVALYDGVPVPKVIDFGIAKATGPSLAEGTQCTGLGQVVGTLEYMSPEQADPQQLDIDTRSDLYSLGVLLYELLTGTTPLERRRLKAAALLEILRLIREEEPPRPSTRLSAMAELPAIAANRGLEAKKLSGLVRGELDWLVMKCLEKDRNRRYETVNALTLDLQRYLHDEPVQACPPSAWYRFRKFARRNKAGLIAAGLVAATLLLGTAVSAWQAVRATRAEDQAQGELTKRKLQQERAEESLDLSLKTIDRAHADWGRLLREQPHMKEWAMVFNRNALAFYREFARNHSGNPRVREGVARAHYQIGIILQQLGQHAEAATAFRAADARFKELAEAEPGNRSCRVQRSHAANMLGSVLKRQGQARPAEHAFRAAVALGRQLLAEDGSAVDYLVALGHALHNLAQLLEEQGQLREAQRLLEEAVVRQKAALAQRPRDPECRDFLCMSYGTLAQTLERLGRPAEAARVAGLEVQLAVELEREFPRAFGYQYTRAMSLGLRANMLFVRGRSREAAADYAKGRDIVTELCQTFPEVPHYQALRAQFEHGRGKVLRTSGQLGGAEQAFRRSLPWAETLVKKHSATFAYRNLLADILEDLASLMSRTGRYRDAGRFFRRALAEQETLCKAQPANIYYRNQLARTVTGLAVLGIRSGRLPEAERACRRALALYGALLAQSPEERVRNGMAFCYLNWGNVLRFTRRPREAAEAYRKGLELAEELKRGNPGMPEYERGAVVNLAALADMLAQTGRAAEAEKTYAAAVARAERQRKLYPDNPDNQASLVVAWSNRGVFLKERFRFEEAGKANRRALVEGRAVVKWMPEVTEYRQQLVKTLRNEGELLARAGQPREAEAAYREALAQAERLVRQADAPAHVVELAACHTELGRFLRKRKQFPEAEGELRRALKVWQSLLDQDPKDPRRRHEVYQARVTLGHLLILSRKLPEAGRLLEEVLTLARALAAESGEADFRRGLARAHVHRGNFHRAGKRYPEAEKDYREALRLTEAKPARFPGSRSRWWDLVRLNGGLIELLHDTGRPEAVIAQYEEMIRKYPREPNYREALARYLPERARERTRQKKFKEAAALHGREIALLEGLAKEFPKEHDYRLRAVGASNNLALVLEALGQVAKAEVVHRRGIALAKGLLKEFGNVPLGPGWGLTLDPLLSGGAPKRAKGFTYADLLTMGYKHLAVLLHIERRPKDLLRLYRDAVEHLPDSAEMHNNLAWQLATIPEAKLRDPAAAVKLAERAVALKKEQGDFWNTLGVARYYARDWPGALAALKRAVELHKGGDPTDAFFLAMAHRQLGDAGEARKWYDRAVGLMKGGPQGEELRRFRAEAAKLLGVQEPPAQGPPNGAPPQSAPPTQCSIEGFLSVTAGGSPAVLAPTAGEPPAVTDPAGEPPAVTDPAGEPPAVTDPAGEPPAVTDPAGEPPAVTDTAGEPPAVTERRPSMLH